MQIEDIAIVVPTRNEEHNIRGLLDSLPAKVVLIVVDASEDTTPALVESLRLDRTLVLRERANVTEARQIGAGVAQAPWLLFTDADIVFAVDYFQQVRAYGEYDALYGPKLSTDDYSGYYRLFSAGQRIIHALGIPAASGSNLLVRREVFEAVGGFDLDLMVNEDSELPFRIKRAGYRVGFAPDLLVYARDHRRLEQGRVRKTLHSLARCTLLYLNMMPASWRRDDWGYWRTREAAEGRAEGKARTGPRD